VSQRTASHGTFTIERDLPHPPARVFAAWADPKAKAQWFAAPRDAAKELVREHDFRVGGKGTRLILTEQGAYLDGGIDGHKSREQGTVGLVANLEKFLDG